MAANLMDQVLDPGHVLDQLPGGALKPDRKDKIFEQSSIFLLLFFNPRIKLATPQATRLSIFFQEN